jgi:hypothetical protein
MNNLPEENKLSPSNVQNPSRRRLLKAIAAGGAVTAVSLLPGKWSSPSVKSGVLPAHAQVTPGRYEVRCNPEFDWATGEVSTTFYFSATVWDTQTNQPLAGVGVQATFYTDTTQNTQNVTSSAQGVADFQITIANNLLGGAAYASIGFEDQQVYGTASCSIDFEQQPQ